MAVKVGTFTKSTAAATASQAIADVGFTPKALILWTSGTTSDATFQADVRYAIGITTGASASRSIAGAAQDDLATTNASCRAAEKALTIVEWGESLLAECDLTSFDAGGFTLSWTTNNATAYIINYVAIGGDEITAAKMHPWTVPDATGNHGVTGVGFQPALVFHLVSRVTGALPVSAADCSIGIGAMDAAAQWAFCATSRDNLATSQQKHVSTDAQCIRSLNPNTAAGDLCNAAYTSLDADGFTVNFGVRTNGLHIFSLCLAGTALDVGSFQRNSASGTQAVTGVGFAPNGVLMASVTKEDTNTQTTTDARLSIGAMTSAAQRAAHWQAETGAATSNANVYSGAAVAYDDLESNASLSNTVTYTSMDADGFTVAFDSAVINQFYGWLAIGGAAAGSGLLMQHYHHSEFHGGGHK